MGAQGAVRNSGLFGWVWGYLGLNLMESKFKRQIIARSLQPSQQREDGQRVNLSTLRMSHFNYLLDTCLRMGITPFSFRHL